MKKLIIICLSILYSISTFAMCESSNLSVFPQDETINQNSIFVLEGYGSSQTIILGLNKKYNVYLKSNNKKIKLLVTEICIGQFKLTQAILKPETLLEAGVEYLMYIDNLPLSESLPNNVVHKYKVSFKKDTIKPEVKTNPKEVSKSYELYDCGPSVHVVFNNTAKDNSKILVKTTVKNLKTAKETVYYILPDGDKLNVGHGMCSGAFYFDESNDYEIEFSFMDASGNITNWEGQRIKFTRPISERYEILKTKIG